MDRDWLDDIRDKMEDFEESAPEGLWRGIESSLDVPRTRRTVILPWVLRTAAVAAALAAVVLAGTQLARNGQKSTIDPNNPNQLTEVGSDAGSIQENQDSPKTIPSSSVNHGILAPSDASADSRLVAQAQDIFGVRPPLPRRKRQPSFRTTFFRPKMRLSPLTTMTVRPSQRQASWMKATLLKDTPAAMTARTGQTTCLHPWMSLETAAEGCN